VYAGLCPVQRSSWLALALFAGIFAYPSVVAAFETLDHRKLLSLVDIASSRMAGLVAASAG
jgi:hypothetical protein